MWLEVLPPFARPLQGSPIEGPVRKRLAGRVGLELVSRCAADLVEVDAVFDQYFACGLVPVEEREEKMRRGCQVRSGGAGGAGGETSDSGYGFEARARERTVADWARQWLTARDPG